MAKIQCPVRCIRSLRAIVSVFRTLLLTLKPSVSPAVGVLLAVVGVTKAATKPIRPPVHKLEDRVVSRDGTPVVLITCMLPVAATALLGISFLMPLFALVVTLTSIEFVPTPVSAVLRIKCGVP